MFNMVEMYRQWLGKNINLASLSKCIEEFFLRKRLSVKKEKFDGGFRIVGVPHDDRILENIVVEIKGNPNDLTIELIAGERSRSSQLLGLISSLIGGGSLLLKGVRSQEALEKFENEFWVFVEDVIVKLVGWQ